ncbi:MAG: hypothetical protein Q8K74_03665, partial [Candidatus Nitrotoga sp.]|nr:hypothetical protein [Candidatus Nitrotoga sp.]MDP1855135.1 hypothetical protein [Candidatus Nitrotoga sp.]
MVQIKTFWTGHLGWYFGFQKKSITIKVRETLNNSFRQRPWVNFAVVTGELACVWHELRRFSSHFLHFPFSGRT